MLEQISQTLVGSLDGMIQWLLIAISSWFVLYLARKVHAMHSEQHRQLAFLELTPAANNDKTPDATNQLLIALHGLGGSYTWQDRLLGRRHIYTLEIVASKSEGIRFIMSCDAGSKEAVEHLISSYASDIKVKEVSDPPSHASMRAKILEFRQSAHFAFPLRSHNSFESHDPVGYLTTAMTKLAPDEQMAMQLVIRPIRVRAADSIKRKLMINDDLVSELSRQNSSILGIVPAFVGDLLFGLVDIVSDIFSGGTSKEAYRTKTSEQDHDRQVAKRIKPARTLSSFEQQLVQTISDKVGQPLFAVDIRVRIDVATNERYASRKKSILSALNLYATPGSQALRLRSIKQRFMNRLALHAFQYRLPAFIARHSSILAASELAELYHFPHSLSARTENVIKSLSKTLPAPISLKNGSELDVLIGENVHQGIATPIGLTAAERERHMYIIGGTGNGKTTMMLYSIVQDIRNGKGIAVLDPHGDLAETILGYIPEERIPDVIYLNPDDLAYPIGINLLELPEGLSGDDLLREKDLITESTISVLRKVFSEDDTGGHRIEYILRNTIQTALTMPGSTLFTIFRLLNDSRYRASVVRTLEDQDLKNFWKNELGKAGDFQRVKMAAGITAKIGRFLFSASAKRMLEQERSTINFDDILSSKKILICNFSKGLLGEDTSALFGTTVLAKLQVAALRRARLKQTARQAYYVYVDEFQNFATMSFVQMLSEARKYKLFLTMAEQSTSQQDQQRLVDIILANVGTVVCFRSGSPADEQFLLPLFSPYIEQGDIANLPAYSFYTRIAAVHSQEPLSGMTVLLNDIPNEERATVVVNSSQEQYSRNSVDHSAHISDRARTGSTPPKAAIRRKRPVSKLEQSIANRDAIV